MVGDDDDDDEPDDFCLQFQTDSNQSLCGPCLGP